MSMKLKKKVKELTGDDATQASQITALQAAVGTDDTTAGEFKLSASSGATASDYMALTAKSSDNTVVLGFL